MPHSLETHQRIYDDSSGEYIHVGPDGDGDGTLLAYVDPNGKMSDARVIVYDEQLPLLIQALQEIQRVKAANVS